MASGSITAVCAILFALFAFRFLYYDQRDLVALLHFTSQSDATPISLLPSTIICILILSLPAMLLTTTIHYPTRIRVLAWYPSYAILSMLTCYEINAEGEICWSIMLPVLYLLLTVVLQCLSKVVSEYRNERNTLIYYLTWNFILMMIPVVITLCISNQDIALHKTLTAERLLHEGKYEEVLKLSSAEDYNTPLLTAMRTVVLSKQEMLNEEELLKVPISAPEGKRKSESLLVPRNSLTAVYGTEDIISRHLGYARKDPQMPVRHFLNKAMEMEQQKDTVEGSPRPFMKRLKNYYRMALILDGKTVENNK